MEKNILSLNYNIRRFGPLLAVSGLIAAAAFTLLRAYSVPSRETIQDIETQVVMPMGAPPITDYARYYAYGWKDWRPVVVGVYSWLDPGPEPGATPVEGISRAYAVRKLPNIFDGGCYFVTVFYDESAKRLVPSARNGKPQLAVCANAGAE